MAQAIGTKKTLKLKNSTSFNARCLGPISDLEKHLPSEWWKQLFNSLYLKTDSDVVENELNTIQEIDNLIKFSGISPSKKIVDLCCGQGRHVLELAKRGFQNVHGIDRSRYLVRLARKRGQNLGFSHVKFSEGDARKIRLHTGSIDCLSILGNSFGYFEHLDDDLKVLQEVNRVLTSQGTLYLDITNGQWIKESFQPRSWEWIDQTLLVCRERHLSSDQDRLICREVVIDVEKGVIADQFYAERLYSHENLNELLQKAGFQDVQMLGHVESHSTRDQDLGMMAHRMIIKATAPQKEQKVLNLSAQKKIQCTVILGDPNLPDKIKKDGKFAEEDFYTINQLKKTLSTVENFQFSYLDNHSSLISTLIKNPPAFVFNLCDEGFNNDPLKEIHIPATLEMLNVPYSGSGPRCLSTCYDKALIRALAQSLEIPVPDEIWIDPSNNSAALPNIFPALLKPAMGDSSIGITQHAVVHNAEELMSYYHWLKQKCPDVPVLAQEFLCGREFSVAILGNPPNFEVLPILEVDYSRLPENLPRLLCYESKWHPESDYWKEIRYNQADLKEEEYRSLIDSSMKLFEYLECHDYARFDFRADSNGVLKLLEVNPNPGWCWDGKLNMMAGFANMSYKDLLNKILISALERYENSNGIRGF